MGCRVIASSHLISSHLIHVTSILSSILARQFQFNPDFTYLIKLRIMNTYFWNSKKIHMYLSFVVLFQGSIIIRSFIRYEGKSTRGISLGGRDIPFSKLEIL